MGLKLFVLIPYLIYPKRIETHLEFVSMKKKKTIISLIFLACVLMGLALAPWRSSLFTRPEVQYDERLYAWKAHDELRKIFHGCRMFWYDSLAPKENVDPSKVCTLTKAEDLFTDPDSYLNEKPLSKEWSYSINNGTHDQFRATARAEDENFIQLVTIQPISFEDHGLEIRTLRKKYSPAPSW